MGYRRDGERSQAWKKWRRAHREVLLRTGVPDDVLRDEMSWYFFLEHGYNYTLDFTIEQLTLAEAAVLHLFLVNQRDALLDVSVDGLIRLLEAEFGLPRAVLPQR